ncbi:MAG: hypothetical protein ACKVQS_09645 [Fimbriimonadaceae bacterium]
MTHSLEAKNEIDRVLNAAVSAERELGKVVTAVDNGEWFFLVFQGDPRRAAEAAVRLNDHYEREDLRGGMNLTGSAVEQAQRTIAVGTGEFPLVTHSMWTLLREIDTWKTRLVSPTAGKVHVIHDSLSGEYTISFVNIGITIDSNVYRRDGFITAEPAS